MGAGLKEDLAGWTWVKGNRHGRPDSILGRVGVHVGQRNSPPKSQVQKQVDISKTGVPFSLAPPEFHTTSDQPCSSKQANSQWSPLMPIIEDVNEDEVLSQSTPSPKQNAPLPITIPDDSLALVPYSNGPGVPALAPHLLSKDDYWVCKPSSASTMCMDFGKLEKEDGFFSLYCHSEGNEGDMPFDGSELLPLQVDISSCSTTPMPFKTYLKHSKETTPHAMETRSKTSHISSYGLKLGYSNHLSSASNKRWIFWDSNLLHLISFDDEEQATHCTFSMVNKSNSTIIISSVYGAHTVIERRQLWESLQGRSNTNQNWVVGGDFNAISSPSEYKGQCEPNALGMEEFNSCIEACNLFCPDPSGGLFTWSGTRSRGRTWRRLDRVLVNLAFQSFFPHFYTHHLPKACSDHKAILFTCHSSRDSGPSSFRFLNAWIYHDQFLQVVKDCWTKTPYSGGMRGLVAKLKKLKGCLKEWNKKEFGNIFENLTKAEEFATQTQLCFEEDPTDANREIAEKANAKLLLATHKEVAYWKQKANVRWLEFGDSNSKVFHAFANGKRRKLAINHIISDTGVGLSIQSEICLEAASHFSKQFQALSPSNPIHPLSQIPSIITDSDNLQLSRIPSLEEVQQAVWELDSGSASGPDGFNGVFFRTYWEIIKEEMLKASQEFFLGFPIPRAYGSTLISLIP
ncbi:unnamed protein product [Cuscuta campestris]|uniref:Endonuclease/exonuclease/phosphatase domain-containing protein n=1 Tax=Cuscuta campestris TaxID=132261 RepID=A0A484KB33_9ASTE|nr:unnamed protein product [Cuscuta campestris]